MIKPLTILITSKTKRMKKTLLLLLLTIPVVCFSQEKSKPAKVGAYFKDCGIPKETKVTTATPERIVLGKIDTTCTHIQNPDKPASTFLVLYADDSSLKEYECIKCKKRYATLEPPGNIEYQMRVEFVDHTVKHQRQDTCVHKPAPFSGPITIEAITEKLDSDRYIKYGRAAERTCLLCKKDYLDPARVDTLFYDRARQEAYELKKSKEKNRALLRKQ